MRALIFKGNGDLQVEEEPDPIIEQPTDAIVRVTMACICGSDLHILRSGEEFGFEPGQRVGHEFIGTVEAVGLEVGQLSVGDRVLAAAGVSCGSCMFCREGSEFACERMSMFGWAPRIWQHGGPVQGGQAQFARVPLADHVLKPMPDAFAAPEHEATMLPLTDVMSTGWHGLSQADLQPGERVVVIGDGAVGLSAVHGAKAKDAEQVICVGHHDDRLAVAEQLGATTVISSYDADQIAETVGELTGGEGAHCVVDCVSNTESMATAHATVRAGGTIACLGTDHFAGKTPSVDWYDQFVRNIKITGGLIPMGRYIPELLAEVEAGRLDPAPVLSHNLALDDAAEGYRLMHERAEGVIKVALTT